MKVMAASCNSDDVALLHPVSADNTPLLLEQHSTVPDAVDYKGRLAIRSKHGRWRSSIFIIGVEMAERISYYGISGNLINFLTGNLGQSIAKAAANVNAWAGVASLLPILGAVIADSFLGKYYTIIISSLIYILGLGLLILSAMMPSLSCPNPVKDHANTPRYAPKAQIILFFFSLYMVAVGQGGHKPCVQAFGADQYDGEDPKESKAKSTFFNWWYFGVCMGGLLGNGIMSYVQDNLSWGLGFGIPCIIMVFALVMFSLGTMTYRFNVNSNEQSPFTRVGRVFFFMAARNWRSPNTAIGSGEAQGTLPCPESQQFRSLNKALIEPDVLKGGGTACSKNEVEEAKAVLRLFPIWATSLVFGIVFAQPPAFFTK